MRSLVTMKRLGRLVLVDTEVTDEGIKLLAGSRSLSMLELTGARVSDEAIAALKTLRPDLHVENWRARAGKSAASK
jgi:hypothetical protein